MATLELSKFLEQLEPLIANMEAKVKTENWLYHGKTFRKVSIIWCSQNDSRVPIGLEVVHKD